MPQQIGSAERKHMHIVDMGLTLLAHSHALTKYSDFAFETAVYLISKLLTQSLCFSSPYQILHGTSHNYQFIRVFGWLWFPYLKPYTIDKLDFQSHPCVFLCYPSNYFGYRCLNSLTSCIFVTYAIVFDEFSYPFAQMTTVSSGNRNSSMVSSEPPVDSSTHILTIPILPLPTPLVPAHVITQTSSVRSATICQQALELLTSLLQERVYCPSIASDDYSISEWLSSTTVVYHLLASHHLYCISCYREASNICYSL